jgi:hypothetical protein
MLFFLLCGHFLLFPIVSDGHISRSVQLFSTGAFPNFCAAEENIGYGKYRQTASNPDNSDVTGAISKGQSLNYGERTAIVRLFQPFLPKICGGGGGTVVKIYS